MPRRLAYLEYTIMFDPSETWSHLYDFEGSFAKFLTALGLEAEIITPLGAAPKRVIFIKKKSELSPLAPVAKKQKGPQRAFRDLKKGLK